MQVQLVVASEPHQGRVIPINVATFTIGRSEECVFRLRSPQVSRHHCTIQITSGAVTVQDLGGENGTIVNGIRVTNVHPLNNGDKLTIGPYSFVVSVRASTDKTKAESVRELSPSSVDISNGEGIATQIVDPAMVTATMQPKASAQESEVMFEIRLDGKRVSVTKTRLFDLARKGSVLPDDLVTVAGTKVFADSIQGIVFGNEPSVATPPPPQVLVTPPPVATSPESAPDPFAFPDFGNIGDASSPSPFDDISSGPVVRIAKKESAFTAIWRALDISFSRVYTIEGNNLVIHSVKALYYVIVVVCFLFVAFTLVNFCTAWYGSGEFLMELQRHYIGLATATFGCVLIIVIVRVLIEMLLLAWLESAKQDGQDE